jgi:hypothetical protein
MWFVESQPNAASMLNIENQVRNLYEAAASLFLQNNGLPSTDCTPFYSV